jgi:thiamine kinase-like enzyme
MSIRGAVGDLNDILAQLEPSLGPVGGEPTPLEGGITNRNFKVRLGASDYVVRLHGKDTNLLGISREAERIATEAAAALGIAPAVAGGFPGGLVTRFVACATLDAEGVRGRVVEIAAALRAFHDSGTSLPVRFWVPDLLEDYARIVRSRGGTLTAAFSQARLLAARIASALPLSQARPCHNDLLAGNLICSAEDGATMIVDWEYSGMGHPFFDLGNLAVNNGFGDDEERRLLEAYEGGEPAPGRAEALKLMRVLSDVREAAWGVMQVHVSALEFDFEAYAEEHFERMRTVADGHDFSTWLAAAAA